MHFNNENDMVITSPVESSDSDNDDSKPLTHPIKPPPIDYSEVRALLTEDELSSGEEDDNNLP